jgi:NADH:ubiquinone oxidoreductase subunit
LQKWVNVSGTWTWEYTLYQGLNLVKNANSKSGDTTCSTNTDGTTGLYGVTGVVNSDGSVSLYATNFTIADLDPTYLYGITDCLGATTAGGNSGSCTTGQTTFTQLTAAPSDSNFKGVSITPTIPNGDVEITTTPSGLTVTTSGTGCAPGSYVAPITLTWTPGSQCTLSVTSTEVVSGTQYTFTKWQDGTTNTSDVVTAPSTTAVYNASFTASQGGIYSPAPSSTLPGNSATFQWFGPPGTTAFWIDVGSTQGGNNYYQSGSLPTTTLSQTISSLPTDGSTVYVTLYWMINGSWVSNPYTYTAFNGSNAKGTITSPTPGSILPGSTVAFSWTAGSGATAYWLDVGSTMGGNNYYQSGNLGNVLSTTVSGLPTDGSPVYVTLYTYAGGQWLNNQYSYTAFSASAGLAVMQSPVPGSMLSGYQQTFTWSNGNGTATGYWLDIGSSPGGNQYYQSGNLGTQTSTTVYSLPANGSQIYVTLWSLLGGSWYNNQYTYTSGP